MTSLAPHLCVSPPPSVPHKFDLMRPTWPPELPLLPDSSAPLTFCPVLPAFLSSDGPASLLTSGHTPNCCPGQGLALLSEVTLAGLIPCGRRMTWHKCVWGQGSPVKCLALTGQQCKHSTGALTTGEETQVQEAEKMAGCALGICCSPVCLASSLLGNPASLIAWNSGDWGLALKHSSQA